MLKSSCCHVLCVLQRGVPAVRTAAMPLVLPWTHWAKALRACPSPSPMASPAHAWSPCRSSTLWPSVAATSCSAWHRQQMTTQVCRSRASRTAGHPVEVDIVEWLGQLGVCKALLPLTVLSSTQASHSTMRCCWSTHLLYIAAGLQLSSANKVC
jgi:hypothetical protein